MNRLFKPIIKLVITIASQGLIIATALSCWVFMFYLNKTKIIGRENLKKLQGRRNVLVIANHLSMADSWWIAMACVWPQVIWRPQLAPHHLPEEKNFFKNAALTFLFRLLKCIPIHRGSGDFQSKLPLLVKVLAKGSLIIFPESTRNRNPGQGQLARCHKGASWLASEAKAQVLPVAIWGAQDIMPIGQGLRIGQRMTIAIGEPLDLQSRYRQPAESGRGQITEVMGQKLQELLTQAAQIHNNGKQKA